MPEGVKKAGGVLVAVLLAIGCGTAALLAARTVGSYAWDRAGAAWFGGSRGTVVVHDCDASGGDAVTCRGRFVSDDEKVDVDPVRIALPGGSADAAPDRRVRAVVSGPDATEAYPVGWDVWLVVPLATVVAVGAALVGLLLWVAPVLALVSAFRRAPGRVRRTTGSDPDHISEDRST